MLEIKSDGPHAPFPTKFTPRWGDFEPKFYFPWLPPPPCARRSPKLISFARRPPLPSGIFLIPFVLFCSFFRPSLFRQADSSPYSQSPTCCSSLFVLFVTCESWCYRNCSSEFDPSEFDLDWEGK